LVEEKFEKQEKCRKTLENRKVVCIPTNKSLYLGRDVKDVGALGFSTIREVKQTAQEIEKDLNNNIIDRKTASARLMRLFLIIRNTKRGQLRLKNKKQKAIEEVNKVRRRVGFKPVKYTLKEE